jgi:hypothetical protein
MRYKIKYCMPVLDKERGEILVSWAFGQGSRFAMLKGSERWMWEELREREVQKAE